MGQWLDALNSRIREHVGKDVRGAQSLHGRMERDHGLGHRFAGVIAVKAAEEGMTLSEQVGQPGRIGSGPAVERQR